MASGQRYPTPSTASRHYLGALGPEIDEHLQSGKPKQEASPEVQHAITELDMLLGIDQTKLHEEVDAYVPVPINIRPEDWDGKWVAEKSYLPLQIEPMDHALKVTLPAGMNAIMPDTLAGTDDAPGIVLVGRNTKLHVKAVTQDDGSTSLVASAHATKPSWKPTGMGSPQDDSWQKDDADGNEIGPDQPEMTPPRTSRGSPIMVWEDGKPKIVGRYPSTPPRRMTAGRWWGNRPS